MTDDSLRVRVEAEQAVTAVDQWARAFAAAAHISRRAEPPWEQLTPEQQDQYRADARRVLNATEEQQ